jgi:threonine/homoserine/homoserine lactone efflux protein
LSLLLFGSGEASAEAVFFLRGLAIGLAIAAPVGPIGLLCIRRTLADGPLAGFLCGLGAALADGVYGAVAAFGLTALAAALVEQQTVLGLAGGAFLVVLGLRIMATPPPEAARPTPWSATGAVGTTFLLTLTNPMTILSFAAIFAALGLGSGGPGPIHAPAVLVLGVFLGSLLWWACLAGLTAQLRHRLPAAAMTWLNRISGAVLLAFGIAALSSAFG